MKSVICLSFYFPPDGGGGTQRVAKFCKYLPQFGWLPSVITRCSQRHRSKWEPEDSTLEGEIGNDTRVIRVAPRAAPPQWVRQLPRIESDSTWIAPAWEAIEAAVRDSRPDVVVVSMSPFNLAFVGLRVQRELRVPVVFDLRDPWALDGWRVRSNYWAWRRDYSAMRETLGVAAGVIANTKDARRAILGAFPDLSPERVTVIPNGYDAQDFLKSTTVPRKTDYTRFHLVHAGTLHEATLYQYNRPIGWLRRLVHYSPESIDPGGRTLNYLLRALQIMAARKHPLMQALRIRLIGRCDSATQRCIAEFGFDSRVDSLGYLSHQHSVSELRAADALFLPLHGLPPGRRSRIVPGKTYEYLASGRPILGCLPEGDARDLVEHCGRGYVAMPTDADQIADALDRLYHDWIAGRLNESKMPTSIEMYERRTLTKDLAEFLEKVSESHQE